MAPRRRNHHSKQDITGELLDQLRTTFRMPLTLAFLVYNRCSLAMKVVACYGEWSMVNALTNSSLTLTNYKNTGYNRRLIRAEKAHGYIWDKRYDQQGQLAIVNKQREQFRNLNTVYERSMPI